MAKGLCGGLTPDVLANLTHQPVEVSSGVEAAQHLKNCKHLMILTGAGLSAASGIPTFRGAGGFWTKSYGGIDNPMDILTQQFFAKNPEAFWDWHFDFEDILQDKEPNAGHFAI